MPVNETTGIDPEVDRFVVFMPGQVNSTAQNEPWPRFDGGPVNGGWPDGRKYYKKMPENPPPIDHRYSRVAEWGRVEADPEPPIGYPAGTWEASYTLVQRPVEELKLQIDAEFQRQVRLQFPDSENPATIIEAAGVIARKQAGSPITTEQQALLDSFIGMEDRIQFMRARQLELYAAAENGDDYDQSTGWVE